MSAMLAPPTSAAATVIWRPMSEADLAAVAVLEAQAHNVPWTVGNFRDALATGYGVVVGESGGAVVAYGVLMLAPDEAQLLNLTVAPEVRRRGLGRVLLRRFLDDARRLGAKQCFLEVRVSNMSAITLYTAEGFLPVARRNGYYPANAPGAEREDALVMRRALMAS